MAAEICNCCKTRGWDNCSNTPYLFNAIASHQTVVSYDGGFFDAVYSGLLTVALLDTWSLNDKAKWSRENGLAGCFSWSLNQDEGYTLQNVVRKALGKFQKQLGCVRGNEREELEFKIPTCGTFPRTHWAISVSIREPCHASADQMLQIGKCVD
ncbi:hypothetical protein BKA70DRAFT_1233327 [Coprinopsis sp. MPI-PUGE-AT-0042]|nr:hypothetical protein BKA70DRAFT_1233327 [Coprinopsis sp. MPI-PUGE-AT-0042]